MGEVYTAGTDFILARSPDVVLDGGAVLPGFRLPASTLFRSAPPAQKRFRAPRN